MRIPNLKSVVPFGMRDTLYSAENEKKYDLMEDFNIFAKLTITIATGVTFGKPLAMNLRADSTFVQDAGWHAVANRSILINADIDTVLDVLLEA